MRRPTTEYDTYPGPTDRFRLIERVSYSGPRLDSTPVWDLFAERQQVMAEMTAVVAQQLRQVSVMAT